MKPSYKLLSLIISFNVYLQSTQPPFQVMYCFGLPGHSYCPLPALLPQHVALVILGGDGDVVLSVIGHLVTVVTGVLDVVTQHWQP